MTDKHILRDEDFDLLFRQARTHNAWQDREVSDVMLRALYDLVKWGPTSANCSPMRLVFVKSPEAKARLKPFLAEGNVEKTMDAPVTAIVGQDYEFYEHLHKLFPHTDAKSWFVGDQDVIDQTTFRNASLQAGYMIIAARGLGLDCGPMSGFDADGVNGEFFGGTSVKANFICNLGYGDDAGVHPRTPRFDFDEICKIL